MDKVERVVERVFAFIALTGVIWADILLVDFFWPNTNIPKSELIWVGGFLQIVAFLLCFMVPHLLAKMSAFLWRNRGPTARNIEKMIYDPDFDMDDNE